MRYTRVLGPGGTGTRPGSFERRTTHGRESNRYGSGSDNYKRGADVPRKVGTDKGVSIAVGSDTIRQSEEDSLFTILPISQAYRLINTWQKKLHNVRLMTCPESSLI